VFRHRFSFIKISIEAWWFDCLLNFLGKRFLIPCDDVSFGDETIRKNMVWSGFKSTRLEQDVFERRNTP